MNPEVDPATEDMRSRPSFLRGAGRAALGIGAAYAGLKAGEQIFDLALSFPVEIGLSTIVNGITTAIANAKYNRNSPPGH